MNILLSVQVAIFALLLGTWIEIASAQHYYDNGMKYYNNIISINGGSDDGWRMVLPRIEVDQEQVGKSPDSAKSSQIHNYFVFEGRKYGRVTKIPTTISGKTNLNVDLPFKQQSYAQYPDWLVRSYENDVSEPTKISTLTPNENAVSSRINYPKLDPANIPAMPPNEIVINVPIDQSEIDYIATPVIDPSDHEIPSQTPNENPITSPIEQNEIGATHNLVRDQGEYKTMIPELEPVNVATPHPNEIVNQEEIDPDQPSEPEISNLERDPTDISTPVPSENPIILSIEQREIDPLKMPVLEPNKYEIMYPELDPTPLTTEKQEDIYSTEIPVLLELSEQEKTNPELDKDNIPAPLEIENAIGLSVKQEDIDLADISVQEPSEQTEKITELDSDNIPAPLEIENDISLSGKQDSDFADISVQEPSEQKEKITELDSHNIPAPLEIENDISLPVKQEDVDFAEVPVQEPSEEKEKIPEIDPDSISAPLAIENAMNFLVKQDDIYSDEIPVLAPNEQANLNQELGPDNLSAPLEIDNAIVLPIDPEDINVTKIPVPELIEISNTELDPASISDHPPNENAITLEQDEIDPTSILILEPNEQEEISPELDQANVLAPPPESDLAKMASNKHIEHIAKCLEERLRPLYSEWLAQNQAPVVEHPFIPDPAALDPHNNPAPELGGNYAELLAKGLEGRLHNIRPIIVVLQPLNHPHLVGPGNPTTPIIYGPPVNPPETYFRNHDLYAIPPEYRGSDYSDAIATADNDLELDENSVMTAEDALHWKYFTNLIIKNRWNRLNRQSQMKAQS